MLRKSYIIGLILVFSNIACTTGTFKITEPSSKIVAEVNFNTLWSDVEIDKLSCKVLADGSREFTFGNLNNNSSNGQASFNAMFPALMENVVKGAMQGVTGIK